jgi:hypothetical protein
MRAVVAAIALAVMATALMGPADAAARPDRSACHRMVSQNTNIMVNGHRTRAYRPAMRRCMTGQPV